jgi:excisionase family DNA binding protein
MSRDDDEYLTPEEAAALLRVSRRTVERYAKQGRIGRYRKGFRVLFKRSEVEQLRDEAPEAEEEDDS